MPNVKSAIKRSRTNLVRNQRNRIRRSTMRTFIKKLRSQTDTEAAAKLLPEVFSNIDKSAKAKIIHKKKADRIKSRLSLFVARLSAAAEK